MVVCERKTACDVWWMVGGFEVRAERVEIGLFELMICCVVHVSGKGPSLGSRKICPRGFQDLKVLHIFAILMVVHYPSSWTTIERALIDDNIVE